MKKFTYGDYLKYEKYMKNNRKPFESGLKEESERYYYDGARVYHKHDKIFREVLEDKREVASFINKVLKLENTKEALNEEDIEKYNSKFITENFKYAEMDVIYRKIDENIFFLIEHQSTIDYSMPYRILMYSLEIMKNAVDEKQLKNKYYKLPMVYSIVIYTGNKKWNVEKYIEDKQRKIPGCEPIRFYEYNVVDINEYTEGDLLKDKMFLPKLMFLEKATTSQEMIENLNRIMEEDLTEKNKIFLKRMIYHIFSKEIGKEETSNLLEKLKIEKGGNSMVEELLRKGIRDLVEKIKKEEIARVMELEIEGLTTEQTEQFKKRVVERFIKEQKEKTS